MRIGYGFDLHAFGSKKPLIIGGVLIPYKTGLIAYSDGDLLIHSVIDALLGAVAMGDIGQYYPSHDDRYKNIDSRILLKNIWHKITIINYVISNIDITIVIESPKMSSYIACMRENLALDLNTNIDNVSIKSTSYKKVGIIGKKKAMACHSVVMLMKKI